MKRSNKVLTIALGALAGIVLAMLIFFSVTLLRMMDRQTRAAARQSAGNRQITAIL